MKKTLAYALLAVLSTSAVAANEGFGFGVTAGYNGANSTTNVKDATAAVTDNVLTAEAAAGYSFSNGLALSLAGAAEYSLTQSANNFLSFTPTLAAAMTLNLTDKFSLTPTVGVSYGVFSVKTDSLTLAAKTAADAFKAANANDNGAAYGKLITDATEAKTAADTALVNAKTALDLKKDDAALVAAFNTATQAATAAAAKVNALPALATLESTDKSAAKALSANPSALAFPIGIKAGYAVSENVSVGLAVNNKIHTSNMDLKANSEIALSGTYAFDADSALRSVTAQVSMLGGENTAKDRKETETTTMFAGIGASVGFNF